MALIVSLSERYCSGLLVLLGRLWCLHALELQVERLRLRLKCFEPIALDRIFLPFHDSVH